ncbi:MAG: type III-B CRISPR module-associated Cmr3 family protein [candidate division WOR-3 bacterium]
MSEVVSMSFRILEPMMFRGPGEFDPYVRGTYSRATTLAMPSPSTIAGVLATYCISVLGVPAPSSGDWLERYHAVLGNDVRIKGPLIKFNGKIMAEDRLLNGFLEMGKVKQKCEIEYKKLANKHNLLEKLSEYLSEKKEEFKPSIKLRKDVRIGVGLEIRGDVPMKSVKEGFLYTAEYIDYMRITSEKPKETSVEIVAEIRGKLVENLPSIRALPVKLGGEGRIALLSFQSGEKILEEIKKFWKDQERYQGLLALYLATPALFKGGKRVKEYVKNWVEHINCRFMGISGESTVLGAGFMIDEKKRKPIYTSLHPGSIIFVEGNLNLLEIYQDKPLGEASTLGYGTILPIPITPIN